MNGKGLMRVLYGMLVVATMLAVASLAMVRPVGAAPGTPPGSGAQPMGCPITWTETRVDPCGTCDWYKQTVRYFWCYVDPCYGTPQRCIQYDEKCVWCR